MQELLRSNAYLNIQDVQGTTPLYHACDKQNDEVAMFLLTLPGIDVNVSSKDCWKPIRTFFFLGVLIFIKMLVPEELLLKLPK